VRSGAAGGATACSKTYSAHSGNHGQPWPPTASPVLFTPCRAELATIMLAFGSGERSAIPKHGMHDVSKTC
jgi:hypothetical protein